MSEKPCDCIKQLNGYWHIKGCNCGDRVALTDAAQWCEAANVKEFYTDELNKCCKMLIENGISTGHADSFTDLIDECIGNVLESRAGPWIPVSKRLPNDQQSCLYKLKQSVRGEAFGPFLGTFHAGEYGFTPNSGHGWLDAHGDIEWMVIPE